jgi:class 3 adenylate cyclase
MPATRRLAAILAADVAGYSRLMGADEEGTLERLKALRRELVDPKIAEHHGRLVKTTGDGVPVEFASVVDAVRCAVEVQKAMPERNTGVEADNRIELRIGINLGDVIVEGDDLYGDGVNIFICHRSGASEPIRESSSTASTCAAASAASEIGKLATSSRICRSECLLRSCARRNGRGRPLGQRREGDRSGDGDNQRREFAQG